MSYNTNLPPVVKRTSQNSGSPDNWELRDSTGTTIQTYTQNGMRADVWFEDIINYVHSNASSIDNAVSDICLLMMKEDWTVQS